MYKKIAVEEDKLMEVLISKNDIKNEISTHRKRNLFSSTLVTIFIAWMGLRVFELYIVL